MFKFLKNALSEDKIQSIQKKATDEAKAGDTDAAWNTLQPLLRAQRHQQEAAKSLVSLVDSSLLPIERGLELLANVYDAYSDDPEMIGAIGAASSGARDIDQLNSGPPDHPLFTEVIERLQQFAKHVNKENEEIIFDGLATAARMVARQRDEVAESSYKRLVEIDPDDAAYHYNLGLYFKTRGRFRD